MAEFLQGLKRTDYCGDVTSSKIGEEVVVMGFTAKYRNLGNLLFVDLRDRTGIVQIAFNKGENETLFEKADAIRNEYVLAVRGKVVARDEKNVNKNMKTGEIEIEAIDLKILSEAEQTPFFIADNVNTNEALRLKYRYLDLRRPYLQNILMMRDKIVRVTREYMAENGFLDIETPFLGKSTPEGARDYLVPSRIHQGQFYALPQSPQIYKQLLMIAGFDRYYQVARCFRDEDLRANRQPEFSQIDMEMSFVDDPRDVMDVAEGLIKRLFKECVQIDFDKPFEEVTWRDAMNDYGSDKPDRRFGMKIVDINSEVKNCGFGVFTDAIKEGGSVRLINAEGLVTNMTRKELDSYSHFVTDYGAKAVANILLKEEGVTCSFKKFMTDEEIDAIIKKANAKTGDAILIVANAKDKVVLSSLGALRLHIAKKFNIYDENIYDVFWLTEFPMFEYSEEEQRLVAEHHPFTSPMNEDLELLDTEPLKARAKAYDLVINGEEAGGGSIRIFHRDIQKKMFEMLGMGEQTIKEKFGFFVEAFNYGTPPHGGLAFGLDRLVMLLTHTDSIKDVIAFPKVQNASCLMTGAPDYVEDIQLKELALDIDKKDAVKND